MRDIQNHSELNISANQRVAASYIGTMMDSPSLLIEGSEETCVSVFRVNHTSSHHCVDTDDKGGSFHGIRSSPQATHLTQRLLGHKQ
jgi:hypothetical protein